MLFSFSLCFFWFFLYIYIPLYSMPLFSYKQAHAHMHVGRIMRVLGIKNHLRREEESVSVRDCFSFFFVVYSMFVCACVISIDERRLSCTLTRFSSFSFLFSLSLFVFMEVYSFFFVSRECNAVKQKREKNVKNIQQKKSHEN